MKNRRPWLLSLLPFALLAACQDPADTGAAFEPTPVEPAGPREASMQDERPSDHPPAEPPAAPTADEAADAEATLPAAPGADPSTFSTGASSAAVTSTGRDVPILRAVRIGRHDGFDRLVFEFDSDGLPQWHVAYLDGPAADCGSGADVPLQGQARLQVRFSGAHAHTEAGEPTSGPRRRVVGQPALRELVRTCDFEAEVTWVAGVSARNAFRPRALDDPARLVVDVAH